MVQGFSEVTTPWYEGVLSPCLCFAHFCLVKASMWLYVWMLWCVMSISTLPKTLSNMLWLFWVDNRLFFHSAEHVRIVVFYLWNQGVVHVTFFRLVLPLCPTDMNETLNHVACWGEVCYYFLEDQATCNIHQAEQTLNSLFHGFCVEGLL